MLRSSAPPDGFLSHSLEWHKKIKEDPTIKFTAALTRRIRLSTSRSPALWSRLQLAQSVGKESFIA